MICIFVIQHVGHCTIRNNGQNLAASDITVAQVLKSGGYDTAQFGKWGIGETKNVNDPISKGFDYYLGQIDTGYCHNYYPYTMNINQTTYNVTNNKHASREECGMPDHENCDWCGDIWINKTMEYLKQPQRSTKPFFVYLALTTPHAGDIGTTQEYDVPIPRVSQGPYWKFNTTWPRVAIDYATAVWTVDEIVGKVMDTLDKEGLSDNTIIFFASDNGASNEGGQNYQFFASSGYLTGWKRSLKEGGSRTPLVIKWPTGIDKSLVGTLNDYQFGFWDFMATAADIAGIDSSKLPENDGISIKPLFETGNMKQKPWVYHEYCAPNEYSILGWGQAVRINNMSGVCVGPQPYTVENIPVCLNTTGFWLYNLTEDIGQNRNIAMQPGNEAIIQQMVDVMQKQHTRGHYCGNA